MKKNNLLNTILVATTMFSTAAPTLAAIDENSDVSGSTNVEITLKNNDSGGENGGGTIDPVEPPTDPSEPGPEITDPENPQPGEVLPPHNGLVSLVNVPELFSFETELQSDGNYTVTSEATEDKESEGQVEGENKNISVYNTNKDQSWQVWAGAEINASLNGESSDIELTSFLINEDEVVGSGSSHLVFKSIEEGAEGTGLKEKLVEKISVGFKDTNFELEDGSKVTTTIQYKLVNWLEAE